MTTEYQRPVYISVTDTAKMIRKQLKLAFPGVKFSVRSSSYSGGASIRVEYTNGPTEKQVKAITDFYEGRDFDGMIDLATSKDATLGTQRVHFLANYVFVERNYTTEFLTAITEKVCQYWGVEQIPQIAISDYDGTAYINTFDEVSQMHPGNNGRNLHQLIYLEAQETAA